jgi:archaellum component FlaC
MGGFFNLSKEKMDTIEERLEKLSNTLGMSVVAISEAIGLSRSTLSASKKNKSGFSSKHLAILSERFPQINIMYLITGEGDIMQDPQLTEIRKRLDRIEKNIEQMGLTIGGRLERLEATNDMLREFLAREGVTKKIG